MQKLTKITKKNFHPSNCSRDVNDYMPVYSGLFNKFIDQIKLYIAEIIALIKFGDLADAPPYAGETGKILACNSAEDGLEFIDPVVPYELPYKIYVATLTQTGTAVPVVTVLQNTLGGTPIWAKYAAGSYYMTLAGIFTSGKTTVLHNTTGPNYSSNIYAYWEDVNTIYYESMSSGVRLDGNFYKQHTLEVRVYP
tara:strand:- start:439 stop:1023 length:585 start_codon:yes stop_codon:yes gene_type:complete